MYTSNKGSPGLCVTAGLCTSVLRLRYLRSIPKAEGYIYTLQTLTIFCCDVCRSFSRAFSKEITFASRSRIVSLSSSSMSEDLCLHFMISLSMFCFCIMKFICVLFSNRGQYLRVKKLKKQQQ